MLLSAIFDSNADELGVSCSISMGNRPVREGEKRIVKPWTIKGGHVETSWVFPKKDFRKDRYQARVTVTDPDGFGQDALGRGGSCSRMTRRR